MTERKKVESLMLEARQMLSSLRPTPNSLLELRHALRDEQYLNNALIAERDIIRAEGFAAGQEAMRERAAQIAGRYGTPWIADAICSLPVEQAPAAEPKRCNHDFMRQPTGPGVCRRCGALEVEHDYLSTACYHGLHDRCRKTCKFCSTPCRCECHHARTIHPNAHTPYVCDHSNDPDQAIHCPICKSGLVICVVCGGVGAELPTHCPGRKMTERRRHRVALGQIDFKDETWITLESSS